MNDQIKTRIQNAVADYTKRYQEADYLTDEIKAECIAAVNLLANQLMAADKIPVNPHYAAYESTPEAVLEDMLKDHIPDLCPKAFAYMEEQRLKRLSQM